MFHWISSKHPRWNADVLGTIYLFDGRPFCTTIFRLKMIPRTTAMIAAKESASYCQKGTHVCTEIMISDAEGDGDELRIGQELMLTPSPCSMLNWTKWSQTSSLAVNLELKVIENKFNLYVNESADFLQASLTAIKSHFNLDVSWSSS